MWPFDTTDSSTLDVTTQVLGRPPDEALTQVEAAIETHFEAVHQPDARLTVDERLSIDDDGEPVTVRDHAYDSDTDQYEGEKLLQIGRLSDGEKTIVLADVPVTHEGKWYILGLSYLDGPTGLISTYDFYEDGEWTEQSSRWVRKEAMKILGQLLGAEWCDTEGCVMQHANTVEELSQLDEFICESCQATIGEEHLQ